MVESEFAMNRKTHSKRSAQTQRTSDARRLRNWKRWGAYLAECEWALMWLPASYATPLE